MMDPYRILGITNRRVPHAELRAAYLKLAKQWHPDGHPTHKQAHATHQFKLISQAWDAIGTPSKRQKWDAQHYYGHSNTTYRTSTPRRNTTYDHYQQQHQQQQQQQQQQYYAEHDVHMKTYSTQEKIWFVVVLMVGSIGWWWWDRMKTAKAGVDVLVPAFFNRATGEWQRAPPEMFNSRDPFVISLIEYKPIHTLVGSDATTATAPITRVITSTTPTPVPGVRAYQLPFPTSGATKENHTTTTHTPTSTSNASSSTTTPQTTNPTSTSESNKAAVASDPLSTTSSPQQVSVTSSNTDTSAPATATTSIQQLITSTPDSSSTPISTSASFANIHPLDVIPMNASHLQRQSITSNTHHHTNHPQPVSQPFIPHDMST